MPEALRIRGDILLSSGNAEVAEDQFRRALDLSNRQGALFWEVRSAISLAGHYRTQGRTRDAHDLLSRIYARFTEGFGTADLQHARLLLDAWGSGRD
jgi:predicted ATPase